ncbi:hypothetical protein BJ878DRAFT_483174 [Calycina marina]|uniref:ubiquitinyl hydrolase 1 n=1 Tax=Calycina marina TaxID=1763456 RepID=A0A9P7YWX5_9HELO|nr:hypothetical protein BJ878DRAFT_483174 [Calycina marina]
MNANTLLELAVSLVPPARVILDLGTQVLELQNEEVAARWLSSVNDSEVSAAIFFDSGGELCVLSRNGIKESLNMSPFAKQIGQCLVYLDETYTRCTDLRVPTSYRAVVTLRPGLMKDRIVQAFDSLQADAESWTGMICRNVWFLGRTSQDSRAYQQFSGR